MKVVMKKRSVVILLVLLVLVLPSVIATENVVLISSTQINNTIGEAVVRVEGLYVHGTNSTPNKFILVDAVNNLLRELDNNFVNVSERDTSAVGMVNGLEITYNGSDYWVLDNVDRWIRRFNSTLDNSSDIGFPSNLSASIRFTTLANNGSNFFATDMFTASIFVLNYSGSEEYRINCTTTEDCNEVISLTTIDGNYFWVMDTGGDISQINTAGDTVAKMSLANVGNGVVGDGNLATLTTTNGVDFWIGSFNDYMVHQIQFLPSNISISPSENVLLPQVLCNVSTDFEGLERTYTYCTWRVNGNGEEAIMTNITICPVPQQNHTFSDSGDYYARMDYATIFWNNSAWEWQLQETGSCGEVTQSYFFGSIPEPPASLFTSIFNTILNVVRAIICAIFPGLGFCP